jgi:hypothetical protein
LVALLADDDAQHDPCVQASRDLSTLFLTTWPVLTEAAWLLRQQADAIPRILALLEDGLIACFELDAAAGPAITALARKYVDIRPQLANLTLLYIAGRHGLNTILPLIVAILLSIATIRGERSS